MDVNDVMKSYWRVLLTLAIAIAFALYSFYRGGPADVAGLAKLVALVMATILGLQIAESFDLRSRFQELRSDTIPAAIRDALREHDSAQLMPFRRTADFMELFDGLQGHCYIYNPHQFAPDTADIDPDEIVASTIRRYRSADFQAMRYLICVGDEYGVRNFLRFCQRLRDVHQQSRRPSLIEQKVRVRVIPGLAFAQEPTYHIQQKGGVHRSVIELRLSPLTVPGSAIPNFYLTTASDDLRTRLLAHFDTTWLAAKPIEVRELVGAECCAGEVSVKTVIARVTSTAVPESVG